MGDFEQQRGIRQGGQALPPLRKLCPQCLCKVVDANYYKGTETPNNPAPNANSYGGGRDSHPNNTYPQSLESRLNKVFHASEAASAARAHRLPTSLSSTASLLYYSSPKFPSL